MSDETATMVLRHFIEQAHGLPWHVNYVDEQVGGNSYRVWVGARTPLSVRAICRLKDGKLHGEKRVFSPSGRITPDEYPRYLYQNGVLVDEIKYHGPKELLRFVVD